MKALDATITPLTLVPAAVEEGPPAAYAAGSPALALTQTLADYAALTKPRLTLMVLFTVAIGFLAAAGPVDAALLTHTLFGSALVAVGASALNQLLERDSDSLMTRTRERPLPAGRITPRAALRFGVLTACSGMLYLAALVNPLTALLSAVTLLTYVFAYTPLKRRTTFNTLVGAVPGALPPVMGWAAATGEISLPAGALFLIVFLWQFPHFWAIAWMYRHDYARAGLRMVPVLDNQGGRLTGRLMVQSCLVLIPVSLLPALLGMAGPRYFLGAALLSGVFLCFAVRFLMTPSHRRARQVLWASLAYLPVLMTLLLADGPLLIFAEG